MRAALLAAVCIDDYTRRIVAADQAAARAVLPTMRNFGAGWSGGPTKADDDSTDFTCADFRPKLADIVVTGEAQAEFRHPDGLYVLSAADLVRTPRMLALDWKRSLEHPRMLPCLRRHLQREARAEGAVFVSAERTPFPRLAPRIARFRILQRHRHRSGRTVPMFLDLIFFGRGRYELTLGMAAPADDPAALHRAEVRLVKLMLDRVPS